MQIRKPLREKTMEMKALKPSPLKMRFAEEYVKDLDVAQAAKRTGIQLVVAKEFVDDEYVLRCVEEAATREILAIGTRTSAAIALKEVSKKTVLEEIAAIAFHDVTDFFREDPDGNWVIKSIAELKRDKSLGAFCPTAAIHSIDFQTVNGMQVVKRIKFHSKLDALDKLAKNLGLLQPEKQEEERGITLEALLSALPPELQSTFKATLVKKLGTSNGKSVN